MSKTFIYIDLETTGLNPNPDCHEVVQIGALKDTNQYNKYIYPQGEFDDEAAELTGLSKRYGQLLYKGVSVGTSSRQDAWNGLLNFLQGYENVVLVGHSIANFDLKFIKRDLLALNLWNKFQRLVIGYVDAVDVFKNVLTQRQRSYGQSDIARLLNVPIFDEHNAIGDVRTLNAIIQKICERSCQPERELMKNNITPIS